MLRIDSIAGGNGEVGGGSVQTSAAVPWQNEMDLRKSLFGAAGIRRK